MIAGLSPGNWVNIGQIPTHHHLNKNDEVLIQIFDGKGYLPELSFNHLINSTENGAPSVWPKQIAKYINKHFTLLQAGRYIHSDNIQPCVSKNNIYALSSSNITQTRVLIKFAVKRIKDEDSSVAITPSYDYVFPKHRNDYRAGDKVLNPKTNKIYQCKPWPYTEFCRLGTHMNEQYEPGIGKNWSLAWSQCW
ncbi:chitin-binding protein [Pseudoalteromonas sp. C2R02]|uniref:chitin-binding protein n=1 Tax=Pseudoalteromonas sp. C2R02 TaxID=2841565 RepID=UPI001C08B4E5|nr:chitin-binding protein [Pseudoalteromonas sp. C2R02]MBU2971174.1 chitin-binding protein [Pseudoalteromonas sp. C2R02]